MRGSTRAGVLIDGDRLEAEVKRTMVEQAAESLLLLDTLELVPPVHALIAPVARMNTVLATGLDARDTYRLRSFGARLQAVV